MFLSEWREFPSAPCMCWVYYRGADKSLSDQHGNKLMFLSEWREFPSAPCMCWVYYSGADKSLAWTGRKQANVSVKMVWIFFGAMPCRKTIWWQLASRCCWNRASSLTSFRAGFLPGRAKELSAQRYSLWGIIVVNVKGYDMLTAISKYYVKTPRCQERWERSGYRVKSGRQFEYLIFVNVFQVL